MELTQDDNLLIQSYFTVAFLTELNNNNFLNSDYYKKMNFRDKYIKEKLPYIGIDNQGAMLIFLYTMLVIPKQLLYKNFSNQFMQLNIKLDKIKSDAHSNYKKDTYDGVLKIDYIRHIRNAVAHAKVEFIQKVSVTFNDEDNRSGESCSITIPLSSMGILLTELQNIFMIYVENLKSKTDF
jgi:hypothetical protein